MTLFLLAKAFPLLGCLLGESTGKSRKVTVLTGGLGSIATDLYSQRRKAPILASIWSQLIGKRVVRCNHYLSKTTKIASTPSFQSTCGSRGGIHEGTFNDRGYRIARARL
jgi:hypothetical protein